MPGIEVEVELFVDSCDNPAHPFGEVLSVERFHIVLEQERL